MFDLHGLGWHSFQQLCLTVAREVLGQTVESFLDVNDGGRDGAFVGNWHNPPGLDQPLRGRFVIQCKFTNRIGYSLKASDLDDELEKVDSLVSQGHCDVYVLMTNAGVSGRNAVRICGKLQSAGVANPVILGADWLDQQIRENKRLRMLVPRIYGLGDLTQILDERAYRQARAILDSMREDLSKVVITDAYRRAARALDEHGYVLLIGEPAAGKTTIASMLAMAAADQWGASVVKIDEPRLFTERWNPDEPSQLFWFDDAFGITQYESNLALGWNHVLPHVKTMIRRGVKVVMTSRDYIYNRARRDLKESAFPLFQEAKVVIDVQKLAVDERRQILYNHLKLGNQPIKFKSAIKPYLELVAAHERFIPETARRLADPFFTKSVRPSKLSLLQFVEARELLLIEILTGLDRHSRAALALVYMRNDRVPIPTTLLPSEKDALDRLDSSLGACIDALQSLDGTLVVRAVIDGEPCWRFKHPTISDAYAIFLKEAADLMEIYVHGSPMEKLMEQVTCGYTGLEKALVLPAALFDLVIDKLSIYADGTRNSGGKTSFVSAWSARRRWMIFLGTRCNRDFLARYLERDPVAADQAASPGLYLDFSGEVILAQRLHELGLLEEGQRKAFVTKVSGYAVEGDDVSALSNSSILSLFRPSELQDLLNDIRQKLLPNLSELRTAEQGRFTPGDDTSDEHMSRFLENLSILSEEFSNDVDVLEQIDQQRARAEEWISDNSGEPEAMPERASVELDEEQFSSLERSIFDDVDQ